MFDGEKNENESTFVSLRMRLVNGGRNVLWSQEDIPGIKLYLFDIIRRRTYVVRTFIHFPILKLNC